MTDNSLFRDLLSHPEPKTPPRTLSPEAARRRQELAAESAEHYRAFVESAARSSESEIDRALRRA